MIILASASPRRRQLLEQIGCPYRVEVSHVQEDNQRQLPPAELACQQAREKAASVAARFPEEVVVAADTVVALTGHIFGKPANREEAQEMLRCLSGCTHQVITGVAVARCGKMWSGSEMTDVKFCDLSDAERERYLDSGEGNDKAGSYAIQGRGILLTAGIRGCYTNVVGLPLPLLRKLLLQAGVEVL